MQIPGTSMVVTGGASGLGLATATALVDAGAHVLIVDLAGSPGAEVAAALGPKASFAAADVTDPDAITAALDVAEAAGPLRGLVHCAGRSNPMRVVDRDGAPGSLEVFRQVVELNLVGTFNVLRLAAARMAVTEPEDGERGACVLTSSIAATDGQVGQVPYGAAKAGVAGMTLTAARDLAKWRIRVCTIAPGTFATPPLATRVPEVVKRGLEASLVHPDRFGRPEEFASLALHIISNPMLNGETIRLDGAARLGPGRPAPVR